MSLKKEYQLGYVVLEHLPWLETARILDKFPSKKEAELVAFDLNSKSLDSSFSVEEFNLVIEGGLVLSSEEFQALKFNQNLLGFYGN